MGMVSIAPFSALHSVSAPKGYHSFAILSSFKHFTAKENSHKLQLLHKTNVLKAYSIRRGSFSFHGAEKHSQLRKFLVESNPTSSSSSQTHMGTWEDPDDGSGSEDEEEAEEHDLGFQSEWEEEEEREEEKGAQAAAAAVDRSTTNKYEEELVKEVEQLLEQEEKAILQKHATPYMKKISTAKWNPVHTLALSGLVTFMDKLLDVDDVDINLVDKDGVTALHTAIIAKKEAVISHLLRKGASPHVRDADGATPLHYAVQVGTKRIVKLLIKYKVDVNVADNDGWTPLHIAVQSRNRDIAKILLVNGADKSRRNEDGRTPLDLGFCYGKDFKSYDLTKLLKTVPMDREF